LGGLLTSTALSLLVVPVVFTFVDDAEIWLRRQASRLGGHKTASSKPEAAAPR